jgi:hypothetical protein
MELNRTGDATHAVGLEFDQHEGFLRRFVFALDAEAS